MKKTRLKTKDYSLKTNQGFSLVEMMIAMAIFALIIGGVVLFGVKTIQAHTRAQAMKRSLENARFAMEVMNKKIRTSSNVVGDATGVAFTDNLPIDAAGNRKRYCYKIENKKLRAASMNVNFDQVRNVVDNCSSGAFGTFEDLVSGSKIEVSGIFNVKQSALDQPTGSKRRGFVQTAIAIEYGNPGDAPSDKSRTVIQSGVSLRDYYNTSQGL